MIPNSAQHNKPETQCGADSVYFAQHRYTTNAIYTQSILLCKNITIIRK